MSDQSSSDARRANRLAQETSPYLLQHAHNPVDWYPWGEEALQRARDEDKPILLSVGYAACHWCHVMERESFENEDIAKRMNEHFVCIKVDREERPDIDEIYMQATVAMSGSGGWPMTVFLTPDEQKPFFAGTYFPPTDKYGRPGFGTLLERLAMLWQSDRDTLETQARELTDELRSRTTATRATAVGEGAIDAAFAQLERGFDAEHGGFGPAPKFPASGALELLLRLHRRTGLVHAWTMARVTLDGMARGGMYDQLGGGFARYSTDDAWLVPHFEKMLYDNALLARVYAHAYQLVGRDEDARVARETLDYVLREMTSPDGAFYSATDADSEGVEGKFFVWTPAEVEAVVPADQARAFCAYYDVTPEGNWEGNSILHTPRSHAEVAAELDIDETKLRSLLAEARPKLVAAREERVHPLLDDKILTAWNALMIGTLAECGAIFGEPRYVAAAAKAADWLLSTMRRPDGGLFRTARAGKVHLDAYLEDYAYLTDALIDVYEASGEAKYLREASALAQRLIRDFHDDDAGGFFATAKDHEQLLVRMREGQDGAIPSANAVAARALVRLGWHLGEIDGVPAEAAERALRAHGKLMERAPRAFTTSLEVVDMLLEGPVQCVLVGDFAATAELRGALQASYLPNRIVVHHQPGGDTPAQPDLVAGKTLVDDRPALYVCRHGACQRPVTKGDEVAAVLDDGLRRSQEERTQRLGGLIAGLATAAGTAHYAERHELGDQAYAKLDGLTVSRIGFGGYRVDDEEPAFAEALQSALARGVNLIDTSTNYANGGSERLVGATLADPGGDVARDEIVVVSKIGYVQASNLQLARQRQAAGEGFAEMVEYDDDCWHCIHPDFLADQLDRSLSRLGLEALDVCLLHNPEYFFSDRLQREGAVTDADRDVFYARVEAAFGYFEAQVKAGRLGRYGVSSNTVASEGPTATSLDRFLAAARAAGGEQHHFRVLQLPANLLEQAGVRVDGVVARARDAGLAVLANRPLNAIVGGSMVRLAAPPEVPNPGIAFDDARAQLADVEGMLVQMVADPRIVEPFAWSERLAGVDAKLHSADQYEAVVRGQIIPTVMRAFAAVEQGLPPQAREPWMAWRQQYLRALERTLNALRFALVSRLGETTAALREAIDAVMPLAKQKEPLARKALWTLRSIDGLTCVLLGMRQTRYVDDAIAVLGWSPLGQPERVLDAALAFADEDA